MLFHRDDNSSQFRKPCPVRSQESLVLDHRLMHLALPSGRPKPPAFHTCFDFCTERTQDTLPLFQK